MPKFHVSLDEALSRLTHNLVVEAMFQQDGITHMYRMPREHAVLVLENCHDVIEESGYFGQRLNMGLHVPLMHRVHGAGWMFIQTRPECRVPDNVIHEREKQKAIELGLGPPDPPPSPIDMEVEFGELRQSMSQAENETEIE